MDAATIGMTHIRPQKILLVVRGVSTWVDRLRSYIERLNMYKQATSKDLYINKLIKIYIFISKKKR